MIRTWSVINRTVVATALASWVIGAQAWYYYQFAGVVRVLLHGLMHPR